MINLKTAKKTHVQQLENKNQFVITYCDNDITYWAFQSYYSLICVYCPSTKEMIVNNNKWDYSKTTLKHLKLFINDFTCYRYENKTQFTYFLYKENNEKITLFDD